MKVLDLQCSQLHVFEGWFASEADFRAQSERGLITCPICGDAQVQRRLSAPRLQRKSNTRSASTATSDAHAGQGPASTAVSTGARPVTAPDPVAPDESEAGATAALMQAYQAAYLQVVQHVVRHTEDVGPGFAEEARRIHYGETVSRGIRGQATPEEKVALSEEGIDVMSLPIPKGLDGPLQ